MGNKKLIVIGGGAAGLFCAVNAARLYSNLDVVILEKTNKILTKVKVSGGGRCNVTHQCFEINKFIKNYPRGATFLKDEFSLFFSSDTIQWFSERNVSLYAADDGRIFPVSNNSQTIVDCLVKEALDFKVKIITGVAVQNIFSQNNSFLLQLSDKNEMVCNYLCVACGGYPKLNQLEWLHSLGHNIIPPVPSLFTFNLPLHPIRNLKGISIDQVTIKIVSTQFIETGPILITHWGLSGPSVLRLSAWVARELNNWNYEFKIHLNWLPGFNEETLRKAFYKFRFQMAGQKIKSNNPFRLPARLWEYFLVQVGISLDARWSDLPGKEQNKLIKELVSTEFYVSGKTTFKDEFVTAGGIDLSTINSMTMESKIHSGLFFAGEILDVDGVTGGFNFQHAWSSGWIAAKTIAEFAKVKPNIK